MPNTQWTPDIIRLLMSVPGSAPVRYAEHREHAAGALDPMCRHLERTFTPRNAWSVWPESGPLPAPGSVVEVNGVPCLVREAEYATGRQIILMRVWVEE